MNNPKFKDGHLQVPLQQSTNPLPEDIAKNFFSSEPKLKEGNCPKCKKPFEVVVAPHGNLGVFPEECKCEPRPEENEATVDKFSKAVKEAYNQVDGKQPEDADVIIGDIVKFDEYMKPENAHKISELVGKVHEQQKKIEKAIELLEDVSGRNGHRHGIELLYRMINLALKELEQG